MDEKELDKLAIKQIKDIIRRMIRHHKTFSAIEKCKYCKEDFEKLKEWAWDFGYLKDSYRN